MLYLVGLGLFDEHDITLRGLEVVKKCARVYLESYTSILLVEKERLVGIPLGYSEPWALAARCRFRAH
jgi:diphthamide biosynthesis methyltransferase